MYNNNWQKKEKDEIKVKKLLLKRLLLIVKYEFIFILKICYIFKLCI